MAIFFRDGRPVSPNLVQVFDPSFCPPEAPPAEGGFQPSAGGKFDTFSAGLLVIQMCFPQYKSDKGIAQFKRSLLLQDWNLRAWREAVEGQPSYDDGFAILDKYGGFGVLEGCLRRDPSRRITCEAAASSGFCRVL